MWWKRALFWGLMPLAAPQGLAARRRAPRFAPAGGPDNGRCVPAAQVGVDADAPADEARTLRLLGFGDSIIDGVGCATHDEAFTGQLAFALAQHANRAVEWRVLGRTGACTAELIEHVLPRVEGHTLDLIAISVGVNDVSTLKRSAAFRAGLEGLVDGLRERAPSATILLCGLPPMQRFPLLPQPLRTLAGLRAQTFDALMADVAAARDFALHEPTLYFPEPHEFAPDGYHPNAATQGRWAAVLAAKLAPRFAAATATNERRGLTMVAD